MEDDVAPVKKKLQRKPLTLTLDVEEVGKPTNKLGPPAGLSLLRVLSASLAALQSTHRLRVLVFSTCRW
jgi:hypothetical protein